MGWKITGYKYFIPALLLSILASDLIITYYSEAPLRPLLIIVGLAVFQNISFSMVSRSRNRDNLMYHLIASAGSNTIWFLTFRELVTRDMNFALLIPYMVGTMSGSLLGVKVSMWIERKIGAHADDRSPVKDIQKDLNTLRKEFVEFKNRIG